MYFLIYFYWYRPRKLQWRWVISEKVQEPRVNERIRAHEIRLIGDDGKAYGVVTLAQARIMADSEGLDLIEISPNANPPVVKMMDYGKYKYQIQKKLAEAKKKQVVIVAGANRSGKTTFARKFLDVTKYEFLNADEIAKEMNPQDPVKVRIAAGKQVINLLDQFKKFLLKVEL